MKKWFVLVSLSLILMPPLFSKEGRGAPRIKAVVFDYGAVIAYADKEAVHRFIAHSLKIPAAQVEGELKRVKRSLPDASFQDVLLALAKEKGLADPEKWAKQAVREALASIHENPGMLELVATLKEEGYRVAMLSNISKGEAALVRERGFYAPFDPVVLSCDIHVSKPKLQAYRILLDRLHLKGENCLFIDDKAENIAAAKKLGIAGIQFHSPDQLKAELQKRGLLALALQP